LDLYGSQKLNSGHTFGSKLNTKTNAQLTAAKKGRGSTLITPKVNTIDNDPEFHKKLLEKMFSNTELDKNDPKQLISVGGAFTAKKQSGEGSNHKAAERDSLGFFIVNP
jgi:hypothetical protein